MASQDISTDNPTEFLVFTKLPKEIRLMIWKKTFPGPRVLEIKYHHGNYDDDGPVMQGYFESDCPLPVLFSACQESYSEFHHQYSISFPRMVNGPRLYFDPAIDNIVIARQTVTTTHNFTDERDLGRLVYPGGAVFNEVENICFTAFSLGGALRFLNNVEMFEGYLRVKTITIATELDGIESDIILIGDNSRMGQPTLEELLPTEDEQDLCVSVITGFSKAYAERFPSRALPIVKIMALQRPKLQIS